jgi:hypothetical protein
MMAKGTTRGNREAKKPKQPKKVAPPADGTSLANGLKAAATSVPPRKK